MGVGVFIFVDHLLVTEFKTSYSMKRSALLLLTWIFYNSFIIGQCDITATASQMEIVCGESVDLSAFGSSNGQVVLDENFDGGGFGVGWGSTPGAVNFNNPCDPGNGTPHAWMDNNTSVPRTLQSASFDLSGATAGVTICFDLLFAEQGDAAPCEGPDEPDEGVYFQYSTDGGATWIDINYFDPNGGNDPMLVNWNTWCFTLPAGALTANTMFRWHQTADSGADYDHWGIDNVQIFQNDINAEISWLHDGYSYGVGQPGGVNPNPVTPTTTTTYTAQIVTGTGDVCTADVTVVVLPPTYDVTLSATPTTVCSGDCSTVTGTGQVVVDPGGIETYENNQLEIVASGAASVNINIQDLNMTGVEPGSIQEICINDFNFSGTELCTSFTGCDCNGTPISFGDQCNIDASSFNITVSTPNGCQITLVPASTITTTGIQDMCFVPSGGTPIASGSGSYTGQFDPTDPFSALDGCDANGVWTLEFNTGTGGLGFGFGSLTGWSITFDDPPIYQPVCYQWSPTTGLSDPNDINTDACPAATTTYDLEVSNCVPGCPTHTESVTITVDPCGGCVPATVTPVVSNETCDGANDGSVEFTIGGTGTYDIVIDGNVEFNDVAPGTYNWTNQPDGTYAVEVIDISDPTCVTAINVTINQGTVVTADSESATDVTNCTSPDGTVTVTATGATSYELFTSAGGSVATNATGVFTGLNAGDYYVVVSNGTCQATSGTVTINNASAPAAPTAGTDATYCVGDPMVDLTVNGTGGTYTWYSDAGLTATLGTGATLAPGTTQGATTYYVTETVAGCESPASTVTITINVCCDLDVVATITDESCDGLNDGTVDFAITGSDTYDVIIDGNVEFNDVTAGTQNWTSLADGTYAVQIVDISDPTCDTTFNVTVNAGPVLTIGSENATDITDCVNPDGTFTVTAAGATSYELYTAAGGLVSTNATGSFTGLNAGDYYVIAIMGTCQAQSSTLTINNASAPPAPTAGTDATYCDGDPLADMTATAGSGGTLTWYDDATLTNVIGTNSTQAPTNTIGTSIYYVTETVSGCESPASSVTITINAAPAAPTAGTDATYCNGDALANMTATAGSAGTLNWYDDAALTNNVGTGATLTPNNTIGTTIYYVTETVAGCESPASTVTITINDNPNITAEASTDITDCLNPDGTVTITSNGTSYELFDASNNSVATNATGAFTGLNAGDYYVVVTLNGCTTTSSTFTINNASAPPAPAAGTDATYCDGDVLANLTATAGSAGTLTWYSDAALTNNIGTGASFAPNSTVGTTVYYVTETVSGCESPASTVTITINPVPAAPTAGTDATYCDGDALANMTATAGSAGTLNWYDDAALTNNIGTGTSLTPTNTIGATTYYVTETANGCTSPASTVTITINDLPTITAEAATDNSSCVAPNGTVTITSNGTSFELFDASNISVGSNATGAFTGLDVGDYYVVVSNGNCTVTSATVTVNDATVTSTNTINATICPGDTYTFADGTSQTLSSSITYVSTLMNSVDCDSIVTENVNVILPVSIIIDTAICEGTNYTAIGDAANFVNVLADFQHIASSGPNGCDTIYTNNVTVIPTPQLDLGSDVTACFGETVTITATSNAGIPAWSTGDTTMSIDYFGSVDTFFVATITTTCGTAVDTIFINVLPLPDIDAGVDIEIPLGNSTDISVTSNSTIVNWSWSPDTFLDCDDCPNPTVGPTSSVTYIVEGMDEYGCVGYDTIRVIIDGQVQIYIPNIFSPNNDGENDLFKVYGATWKHYKMEIYNRWGGRIWVSEDPNVEWDGRHQNGEECPQAVFVYKFWGVTNIGLTFERTGNVMLTR